MLLITPHPKSSAAVGDGPATNLLLELRRRTTTEAPQTGNATHTQQTRLIARTTVEEPAGYVTRPAFVTRSRGC